MKILVIGGSGFIGRHLCPFLAKKNQVLVMARNLTSCDGLIVNEPNISYIKGDIANQDEVFAAMEGIDYVVHLASSVIPSTSNADPIFDVQTNLVGAINILDAAVEHKIKKLVFLSSGGTVYGEGTGKPFNEDDPTNPICSYGVVKLAIEKYIQMYHRLHRLPYAILRVSNPYGLGQLGDKPLGVVSIFLDRIRRGEPIEVWGDGSISRDFIYIDDVLTAITAATFSQNSGLMLNIGSGELVSILDLVDLISKLLGTQCKIVFKASRGFDVGAVCLNVEKAAEDIGWTPKVNLRQGLSLMLDS